MRIYIRINSCARAQFIPDESTGNRVTIKITPEGPDGILLIKSDFEYHTPSSEDISIIGFPEKLTELKEKKKDK